MKFIAIIPARYASTRFPGKPLVDMRGKTMIQRVYEQVSSCLSAVYVATDDARICQRGLRRVQPLRLRRRRPGHARRLRRTRALRADGVRERALPRPRQRKGRRGPAFRALGAVAVPEDVAKMGDGAYEKTLCASCFSVRSPTCRHATCNDPAIRAYPLSACDLTGTAPFVASAS